MVEYLPKVRSNGMAWDVTISEGILSNKTIQIGIDLAHDSGIAQPLFSTFILLSNL
jgi:hypothetical protein